MPVMPRAWPSHAQRAMTPLKAIDSTSTGRYRTCRDMRYRTRPIHPPLQTHLHAVCRGKIPHHRKKPVAQRELRPRCRAFAARPRAATPLSRRPFAFGTRVTIVLLRAVYRTRVPSRGPGEFIVGAGGLARNPSWLKAKATTRSAGGTGSACSKNIVGLRPPYFSAPTSGAEFPAGDRFWDTRHDSPRLLGLSNRRPKSRSRFVFARRNPKPKRDGEGRRSFTSPHET